MQTHRPIIPPREIIRSLAQKVGPEFPFPFRTGQVVPDYLKPVAMKPFGRAHLQGLSLSDHQDGIGAVAVFGSDPVPRPPLLEEPWWVQVPFCVFIDEAGGEQMNAVLVGVEIRDGRLTIIRTLNGELYARQQQSKLKGVLPGF